jgi:hypothetical protein
MSTKQEPDEKCAPTKKYQDGSCFTYESLKKIAESYNTRNNDKIDTSLNKEALVQTLENKLSNKCSEQTCWLRLDFVKEMDNKEIENNTFRPSGPSKKYEWLSTTHINEVIEQYQEKYKDFLFFGAVPYDFEDLPVLGMHNINFDNLKKENKTKIGVVINLDEHYKDGSHWVALYADLNKFQVYFFDSIGKRPYKRIRKFINKITKYMYHQKFGEKLHINDVIEKFKKIKGLPEDKVTKFIESNSYLKNLLGGGFDIRYNHIQHQFNNSECGVYSINFITRLVEGETFDDIITNITKDEAMNQNRKVYFRNVN